MESVTNLHQEPQNEQIILCRICLEESHINQSSNLLIRPCGCKGTAEYVHNECILKWIRNSTWKKTPEKNTSFILCEMCKTPIYFHVGSQSWTSWYKTKPCSAVFYICLLILIFLSFITMVFLVIYAIVTKQFQILRFLGLPFGVFATGTFLLHYCGRDFRDYQKNIITIREKDKREKKSSGSTVHIQSQNEFVQ